MPRPQGSLQPHHRLEPRAPHEWAGGSWGQPGPIVPPRPFRFETITGLCCLGLGVGRGRRGPLSGPPPSLQRQCLADVPSCAPLRRMLARTPTHQERHGSGRGLMHRTVNGTAFPVLRTALQWEAPRSVPLRGRMSVVVEAMEDMLGDTCGLPHVYPVSSLWCPRQGWR